MRNLKSLFCFSIIIFFFQGCARYITTVRDVAGPTTYYFKSGFENKLIESRNDSISEITYFSEYFDDNRGSYATICEFCNNSFEAEIIFKGLNQKEFSYPMVCSDFEYFTRKTIQINPGDYQVFMNIDCSGEKYKQLKTLEIGEFEIKNGERRNLNIWIELEIQTSDAVQKIKIPRREYRKLQKEK